MPIGLCTLITRPHSCAHGCVCIYTHTQGLTCDAPSPRLRGACGGEAKWLGGGRQAGVVVKVRDESGALVVGGVWAIARSQGLCRNTSIAGRCDGVVLVFGGFLLLALGAAHLDTDRGRRFSLYDAEH